MIPSSHRVPFENYGRFFAGFVQRAGTSNRSGRRRVLCFVTHAGVVGASVNFSRAEAFTNATRAEGGSLDYRVGRDCADTLKIILSVRGFPVHSTFDELDDESGSCVDREIDLRVRAREEMVAA